jgi:lipopolysaccharide transport system permease protein
LMTGILSFVFTRAFKSPSPNFPVFLLIGLIMWQWASSGISAGTRVFITHADLLKNAVFPLHILPAARIFSQAINFAIQSLMILACIAFFPSSFRLSLALLWVPLLIIAFALLLVGITLATSAMTIVYRDVAYIADTGMGFLYWLTPVLYSSDMLPEPYGELQRLNPFAAILEAMRSAIMLGVAPSLTTWTTILVSISIVLAISWVIFKHYEPYVADYA